MSKLFPGTDPKSIRILLEGCRRMSPQERLQQVGALGCMARALVISDIQRRHPNASPREQALRLASRYIEPELMQRAFGWDPRREGY